MTREDGYYWVQIGGPPPEIAERRTLISGEVHWALCGSCDDFIGDERVGEILEGPLKPPEATR